MALALTTVAAHLTPDLGLNGVDKEVEYARM